MLLMLLLTLFTIINLSVSNYEKPITVQTIVNAPIDKVEEVYLNVKKRELIEYDMSDGRHVEVQFKETSEGVRITETFDPETENLEDVQRAGWQSILDNFKKYEQNN